MLSNNFEKINNAFKELFYSICEEFKIIKFLDFLEKTLDKHKKM